jgi:hypothetical protein
MKQLSEFGLKITKQNKKYAMCLCPFHNDKNASAMIFLDNMWFICFVCHLSMPLEKALDGAGLDPSGVERIRTFEDLDLMTESYKVKPCSKMALHYLEGRGVTTGWLPKYIVSPTSDAGVGFAFTAGGVPVGAQVRLFPHNVSGKGSRYIFEGRRLPWFGDMASAFTEKNKLFVFEKAFATLKAAIVVRNLGLPIAVVSAVGSNVDSGLLDMAGVNTTFFFDNDEAGVRAARRTKDRTPSRVIVAAKLLDELDDVDMEAYLRKYL